jgi:hypothetical protein
MSPLAGYFLGILTVLIIFIPFWYLGQKNKKIEEVYKKYICPQATSSSGSNQTVN